MILRRYNAILIEVILIQNGNISKTGEQNENYIILSEKKTDEKQFETVAFEGNVLLVVM